MVGKRKRPLVAGEAVRIEVLGHDREQLCSSSGSDSNTHCSSATAAFAMLNRVPKSAAVAFSEQLSTWGSEISGIDHRCLQRLGDGEGRPANRVVQCLGDAAMRRRRLLHDSRRLDGQTCLVNLRDEPCRHSARGGKEGQGPTQLVHQIRRYFYKKTTPRYGNEGHKHSQSLERGLLDGPRLVGLGLLELGEPVRHLLPSFARDPCEGGRTLLVVVGVPEGQRGALGARTPRPADAMDVPES